MRWYVRIGRSYNPTAAIIAMYTRLLCLGKCSEVVFVPRRTKMRLENINHPNVNSNGNRKKRTRSFYSRFPSAFFACLRIVSANACTVRLDGWVLFVFKLQKLKIYFSFSFDAQLILGLVIGISLTMWNENISFWVPFTWVTSICEALPQKLGQKSFALFICCRHPLPHYCFCLFYQSVVSVMHTQGQEFLDSSEIPKEQQPNWARDVDPYIERGRHVQWELMSTLHGNVNWHASISTNPHEYFLHYAVNNHFQNPSFVFSIWPHDMQFTNSSSTSESTDELIWCIKIWIKIESPIFLLCCLNYLTQRRFWDTW